MYKYLLITSLLLPIAGRSTEMKLPALNILPIALVAVPAGAVQTPSLAAQLSLEGSPSLPGLQAALHEMEILNEGPLVALRHGAEITVLPQALKPGAYAAIIPLGGGSSRHIELTREMTDNLRKHLEAANLGLAQQALAGVFDGSNRQANVVEPAARELQGSDANEALAKQVAGTLKAIRGLRTFSIDARGWVFSSRAYSKSSIDAHVSTVLPLVETAIKAGDSKTAVRLLKTIYDSEWYAGRAAIPPNRDFYEKPEADHFIAIAISMVKKSRRGWFFGR